MHLGFALDSSDIDLRDIDLSDTDSDLLDTDFPSKHFVGLQDVLKTWLQDVFSIKQFFVFKISTNVWWVL